MRKQTKTIEIDPLLEPSTERITLRVSQALRTAIVKEVGEEKPIRVGDKRRSGRRAYSVNQYIQEALSRDLRAKHPDKWFV